MNDSVAIPTNGFQILDPVGTSVGARFSVMNLQGSTRPTPCVAPIVAFYRDSTVQHIHTFDERFERHPLHTARNLDHELGAIKCADCYPS